MNPRRQRNLGNGPVARVPFSMPPMRSRRRTPTTVLAVAVLAAQCTVAPLPRELPVPVPGVVIAHRAAASGSYIGCPSLVVLPDGTYVASHSLFGPRSDHRRTVVLRSRDRGATWRRSAELDGQYWSTLFWLGGAVYLLGVDERFGEIVIRRSRDGGRTWTTPRDEGSGRLLDGVAVATGPVPVLVHGGRVWRAFEQHTGRWGTGFRPFVMSAPCTADLLRAASWTCSDALPWPGSPDARGWLEGNVVAAPDGAPALLLRVHEPERGGVAALLRVSADGTCLSFDPHRDLVAMPGASKKFTVRHDPETDLYWSLTNPILTRGPDAERTRNTLALISSPDLATWTIRSIVMHDPDPWRRGFQYVDWQFDGDDLVAVARTAWSDPSGGAPNAHDANYLTFHRIRGFRDLRGVAVTLPSPRDGSWW